MSFKRTLGISFIICLLLWSWFSWPLPRYIAFGIPAAAGREKADLQPLIPGDHLQFMYYCWLAGDMATGKTPLFYNLYEFNTGNDRERFEPDAYYIPFSLIYAAGAWLGGRALGWNLTGFISLWVTYLLTWLLVRRWTRYACPAPAREWVAAVTALLGIALPFRWINLFGGSPAGFAMTWVPAILLGVDLAVSPGRSASAEPGRDDRVKGGVLAGAAILLASWNDSHVFFFGAMAAPVWGVVAFAARPDYPWRQAASYRRLAVALLPIGLFAMAALLFPVLMKGLYRAVMGVAPVAHAIGPRTLSEIMIYSPEWRGFFGMDTLGVSTQIYLGVTLLAFLAAGWLTLLGSALKRVFFRQGNFPPEDQSTADKFYSLSLGRGQGEGGHASPPNADPPLAETVRPLTRSESTSPQGEVKMFSEARNALVTNLMGNHAFRTLIVLTLLGLAMLGIMILALGARGPGHGAMFQWFRAVIPPYAMIRQPAKIFCLMPSFLAVASALALTALVQLRAGRLWQILAPAVFAGLILLDYTRQTNPTISRLEKKQDAYAAVASDAAAGKVVPRALVLPLWPGDSHYASIYQYFASLYRVRMVNGYNPFIKQGYFENVFRRFESVNQGGLSEDQATDLLRMNVRYILLHENLFPEKVSPFPVTATLEKLLSHPRLELLRQDGSVWAFKILESPRATPGMVPKWEPLFPARRFEMEKMIAERQVTVMMSPEAGGRAFVVLEEPGASMRTAPIRVDAVSNLHWLVRARGTGALTGEMTVDRRVTAIAPIPVQSRDWTWLNVPVPAFQGFATLGLKLALQAGAVDLDLSLLTAGPWPRMNPGESVTLPAPVFFHAGYTDLKSGGVVFRRDYDPKGLVFYGPKLPLLRGTYALDIAFSSPAPSGTELAVVFIAVVYLKEQQEATGQDVAVPVIAGRPAQGRWRQDESLPFNMVVVYSANADLEIRQVTFTRLK